MRFPPCAVFIGCCVVLITPITVILILFSSSPLPVWPPTTTPFYRRATHTLFSFLCFFSFSSSNRISMRFSLFFSFLPFFLVLMSLFKRGLFYSPSLAHQSWMNENKKISLFIPFQGREKQFEIGIPWFKLQT